MKLNGDYVIDREVKNMDYIPSNRHGDYIAHSEEYLMHYGVKGMKWKDHDYVEDVKTGAREVVGDVKRKIKQLKKFVSKKFGKKTKTQEREYAKNHKVHEEQDKREADMKISQSKMMARRTNLPAARNLSEAVSVAARADVLKNRAKVSEGSKTNKEREASVRYVNKNADKTVNNAVNAKLKEYLNVGKYDAKQNASMRENNERNGSANGVKATTLNSMKSGADVSYQQKRREKAQTSGQNSSSQVAANNKDKRINSPSTTVNRGTQSRDADIKRGTQNSMNATRDSKTQTSVQANNNINRLASQATPKRPDPDPIAYTPNEVEAKLKIKDDYDIKKYLHSKKNKTNRR